MPCYCDPHEACEICFKDVEEDPSAEFEAREEARQERFEDEMEKEGRL